MKRFILLDAGPLGLVTNPSHSAAHQECYSWMEARILSGEQIVIPEIADYEVRRELLRANKSSGLQRLDSLKAASFIQYEPITTSIMLRAAQFWAQARQQGTPTADPKALDGDVILAAQGSLMATTENQSVVIATTNVGHLSLFIEAKHWRDID